MACFLLFFPIAAAAVTFKSESPSNTQMQANGRVESVLVRREAPPQTVATAEHTIVSPVTMAFAVGSDADSDAGSKADLQVLSGDALKEAVK